MCRDLWMGRKKGETRGGGGGTRRDLPFFLCIEKNGEIFLSGADNVQYDSRPYCVLGSTRRIRADRPSYVGIAATIRVAIAKSPG